MSNPDNVAVNLEPLTLANSDEYEIVQKYFDKSKFESQKQKKILEHLIKKTPN